MAEHQEKSNIKEYSENYTFESDNLDGIYSLPIDIKDTLKYTFRDENFDDILKIDVEIIFKIHTKKVIENDKEK